MFEIIKDYCEKQKVSISDFERVIAVSEGYVYKLKDHQPGMPIARKLAVILGMSLEEIHEMYMK